MSWFDDNSLSIGHTPLVRLRNVVDADEATVLAKSVDKFEALGLAIKAFEMKPLSAATTTAEDLRNMGLLDVATYQALQAADALRDAAQNPSGMAGTGVGLGAGVGMGAMMAGMMTQAMQPGAQPTMLCPSCSAQIPAGSKFCPQCGGKIGEEMICANCKTDVPAGSKFCPNCGTKIG